MLLSKKNVIDKNRFTICSVGRLMPQKAYDRMVRLAYHLKKNNVDVDFWILGTGYLEAELRRLARDLSVEDMVHFWDSNLIHILILQRQICFLVHL